MHWATIPIRFILSAALLYVVWHNAHWSVALVLTLSTVGHEITGFVLAAIKRRL